MDDVRQWLNSKRNYTEGVRIYLQYGRNPLFIALFKEQETPFKRAKLIELMSELAKGKKQPQKPAATPTARLSPVRQSVSPALAHKGWPNPITDPVIQKLFDQWRPVYAEMMNLQARLHDVAEEGEKGNPLKEQEAGTMALRILDLDEECDEFYRQRDHYLQHGHLPGTIIEKPVVLDPVRWVTLMKNAERYVREYKAQLKNDPHHPRAAKWAEKQKQYEDEVAKYRKLLKLDE